MSGLVLGEPATFNHDETIRCEEDNAAAMWGPEPTDREKVPGRWTIQMKGKQMTGTWEGNDRKVTRDIKLAEDYSNACAMDVMCLDTTTPAGNKVFFVGVKPSGYQGDAGSVICE